MTKEERFDSFMDELLTLTNAEKSCTEFCTVYVPAMRTWIKDGGERPHKPNP